MLSWHKNVFLGFSQGFSFFRLRESGPETLIDYKEARIRQK